MCNRTMCDARQLKKHLLLRKKKCYAPEHTQYVLEWIANKAWKNIIRRPSKKSKKLVNFDDVKLEYPTEIDNMIYPTFKFQTFLALTLIYTFRDPSKKANIILNGGEVLVWNNNKKNIMSWDNFIRLLIKKILNDERSPKYWKKYFNNKRVTRDMNTREKTYSTYMEFLNGQYETWIHQMIYLDSKQTVKNVFKIPQWLPKTKKEIEQDQLIEEAQIMSEIEKDRKLVEKQKQELENFRENFKGQICKNTKEPDPEPEPEDDSDTDEEFENRIDEFFKS